MIITFTARLAGIHWLETDGAAILWRRRVTPIAESVFWSIHRGPFSLPPIGADDVTLTVSFGTPSTVSVALDGVPDGTLGDGLMANSFDDERRRSMLFDWVRTHPPQFGAAARLATEQTDRTHPLI